MKSRYAWETWFEENNRIILHKFNDRVFVKTNRDTEQSSLYKDGEIVSTVSTEDMGVHAYTEYLLRIEADARELIKTA